MSISRYIVVAVVRCSWACWCVARAPVELAEAEVAVGDEGAHAELVGQCHGLAVVGVGFVSLVGDRDGLLSRRRGRASTPRWPRSLRSRADSQACAPASSRCFIELADQRR